MENYLSITLVELAEKGSKGAQLGKAIINLADYCKDGLNEVKEVPSASRPIQCLPQCVLRYAIYVASS